MGAGIYLYKCSDMCVYIYIYICIYRLRKKRNTDIPVEPLLLNTILSSCSIIMCCPIDMSVHTPALIYALIMLLSISHTHVNTASVTTLTAVCNYSVIKDLVQESLMDYHLNYEMF